MKKFLLLAFLSLCVAFVTSCSKVPQDVKNKRELSKFSDATLRDEVTGRISYSILPEVTSDVVTILTPVEYGYTYQNIVTGEKITVFSDYGDVFAIKMLQASIGNNPNTDNQDAHYDITAWFPITIYAIRLDESQYDGNDAENYLQWIKFRK